MTTAVKLVLAGILFMVVVHCLPHDDGKYNPKKYRYNDDGKYYRPPGEGKYVHNDEGKYKYVYINTLYPAFPYIHEVGPDGTYGGNGYGGGEGPNGPGGYEEQNGPGGSYGPGGPGGPRGPGGPGGPGGPNGPGGPEGSDGLNDPNVFDESKRIQYIGRRIYAEKYPYLYKEIKALVNKYVSSDLFGETPDESSNFISKTKVDKPTVNCQYLPPKLDGKKFVTESPLELELPYGDEAGTHYSFRGTKVLTNLTDGPKDKLKLEYEVFVRVVDDID